MPLIWQSRCPPHRRYNPLLLDCRLKLRTCQRRTRCMPQMSLPQALASTFHIRSPGNGQLSWRQWKQNTFLDCTADNRPLNHCQ